MKLLSRQDARLTLQFLPIVAGVRWKLWRTPFARLHGQWRTRVQGELDHFAGLQADDSSSASAQNERELKDTVWRDAHAVRRAARLVPRGSCLTQAMALQLILARRGQPCSVCIGVDRGPAAGNRSALNPASQALPADASRFQAHAWVEWQGRVVLGGDIARWKPLTIFAPATLASSAAPASTSSTAESLARPE